MLVLFLNKRSQGVSHWLVGVELNYDGGMALYAPSWNEEAKVYK